MDPDANWTACFNQLVELGPASVSYLARCPLMRRRAAPDDLGVALHTSLLRLLAGVETSDTGGLEPGHGLKIGYFAQEHDTLDDLATVWENIRHAAPDTGEQDLRGLLGAFMFSGAQLDQPAGTLSGGEKTRLALAGLVASTANVLLLDEPTNNLDPASREQVLDALRSYHGAVVLVTHDPGAAEALNPQRVVLLPDGTEDFWSEEYADLIELA